MSDPAPRQPTHPLVQKALARMVTICKGNGLSRQQIRISDARIETVTFTAGTFFDLTPTSEAKATPGRQQQGELIAGPNEIDAIVADMMERAQRNRSLEEMLRQQLATRKDKGFMLEGTILPVTSMHRDVCWHEPCATCEHTGHVRCEQCAGQKYARCQQCAGQTMMQCPLCRGAGHIMGQRGQQPCNKCNGMRRVPCTVCHRTGKIPCGRCRGSGQVTCSSCKGMAYTTHMVRLGLKAQTRADYERGKVPEHMTFLIENNGPQLVADGDVQASAHPMTEEGKMGIHYEASFPFADITFALGKKPVKIEVYGQGKFVRLPHILDPLLAGPLQLLTQAARGQGNVAALLKEAGRYRAIAFALVTAVRANAAQTAKRLMQKYPEGLSPDMAIKIGHAADAAEALITRKPRYAGLLTGLLLVAGLYAAYYLGPGRGLIMPYIPDPRFNVIVDLMLIFLGGTITTLAIQFSAKSALNRALGHLIPPDKRKSFLPRTYGAGWLGYAGGAVIYLVMIELTRHLESAATPQWYKNALALIGLA